MSHDKVLAHVIMVVGLVGANWYHLFPQSWDFVALIFWSSLPAFLFNGHKKMLTP